jgi:DNA-directed RNA polymerase subunit RPC12/RpoP
MSFEDKLKLPVKCPKCGKEFEKPLSRLHRREQSVRCPNCGTLINLKITRDDPQKLVPAFRTLDKALLNLQKSAKKSR